MNLAQRIERKLGFQSLFDFTDITDAINFARSSGFQAVEVNLGNPHYLEQLRSAAGRSRVRAALKRQHLALLCHSVEGLNFFLPDWRHVAMNLRFLLRIINCARAADATHFTFHLGMDTRYGYAGARKYSHEVYPELFARNLRNMLQELKASYRGKMTLGIENVGGFRFPWVFPILHQELGGRLRLTMDVGHINVYRHQMKTTEEDFFHAHAHLIRSAHLHDNDATWDQHNVIGQGGIKFLPYLRLIAQQNAYCIFEVRPKEAAVECRRRYLDSFAPRL